MKRIKVINLVLICALILPLPAFGQGKAEKAGPHGNADYISAQQLKDYLAFIASDELEGRDTLRTNWKAAIHLREAWIRQQNSSPRICRGGA